MQTFLRSAFLQSLSHSLVASIWQMALLWLAAIILFRLFKLSSAQKFNIAFIAQISGFGLFISNCFIFFNSGTNEIVVGETAGNVLQNINTFFTTFMPYAATIYLCVLIFKLSKLVVVYNKTKELRKNDLKKIPAANRIFVQQMCALFSLNKKVKIYLSEKITCPLTIGFLKPIILIPVAAVNHLTAEQMEAVILHELAHIKRADYLLFILQNVVDKIFFFNIFSIMLSNIIERERENACDDWVLQFRYNSMHYAEALFKLGRLKALPVVAMPFAGRKESLLLVRIKRLLHSQNKNPYQPQSVLTGVFSVMIAACLFISFSFKQTKQQSAETLNTIAAVDALKIGVPAADKKEQVKPVILHQKKKIPVINRVVNKEIDIAKQALKENINSEINDQLNLALKQNYIVQVQQKLDSLRSVLPIYQQALNSQAMIANEDLQKAASYQNFKTIENMLAASGDSINVTESETSKNNYQKEITIEAKDKFGNKHTYTVVIQLYQ